MQEQQTEMTFFDHLEELRWHIIRSLIAIAVVSIVCFVYIKFIFRRIILGPTMPDFPTYKFLCKLQEKYGLSESICIEKAIFKVQSLELSAQFMTSLKTALILGFVLAFPYIVWEIWKFISPGLRKMEIKASRFAILFSGVLFFVGVVFGFLLMVPFSVNFFATYSVSDTIENNFSLSNYVNFVSMLTLVSGIMFQLPVAVYLLAKLGLVSAELMRMYRKHAFVIIMILAAVITPADIGTMIIVAMPLYFLYEVSIFIAKKVYVYPEEIKEYV